MSGTTPAPRRALALLLAGAVFGALGVALTRRFQRFEVRGQSMLPGLRDGDYVLVDRWLARRPPPGSVVLAHDPRSATRLIVKRVRSIDLHGDLWLEGDNPTASTDSRTFGPLPPALVVGRVRWRYWPPRP